MAGVCRPSPGNTETEAFETEVLETRSEIKTEDNGHVFFSPQSPFLKICGSVVLLVTYMPGAAFFSNEQNITTCTIKLNYSPIRNMAFTRYCKSRPQTETFRQYRPN